jgi:hypothetical protein
MILKSVTAVSEFGVTKMEKSFFFSSSKGEKRITLFTFLLEDTEMSGMRKYCAYFLAYSMVQLRRMAPDELDVPVVEVILERCEKRKHI